MPSTPFSHVDLIDRILKAIEPYELRSFVIGFERPEGYDRARHEERFRALKVALGEELTRRLGGIDAEFHRPDLRIDVREGSEILLTPAPIHVAGRYRKLSREIPSARWVHHECRGRGCPSCSHSGTLCGPSIQELIEAPVLRLSGAKWTSFHALGREDTDARMLGLGRPFVLEAHRPRRRSVDLEEAKAEFHARAQGAAEVSALRLVGPEDAAAVKSALAEKTYRAWIEAGGSLPRDAAERAGALAGVTVRQLSPARVAHRKGKETVRSKRVVESSWLGELDGRFVWEARVESGAYVKELVSGDGGRTVPSLSSVLGVPCTCTALDVLEVHWAPPWET